MFGLSRLFKRKPPTIDDLAKALQPVQQAAKLRPRFLDIEPNLP
jgi:hypothetical protein